VQAISEQAIVFHNQGFARDIESNASGTNGIVGILDQLVR
jgi:hypothetical protein